MGTYHKIQKIKKLCQVFVDNDYPVYFGVSGLGDSSSAMVCIISQSFPKNKIWYFSDPDLEVICKQLTTLINTQLISA